MTTDYRLVPDIPADLLRTYLKQTEIAVDTEMQGLRIGRDQLCLVQLCDRQNNVCLIRVHPPEAPPNLTTLLTHPGVTKICHFALTDVAFIRLSLNVIVTPFCCTKVMSKLSRTYTEKHGLLHLAADLLGKELNKENQQTDWSTNELSPSQLQYAAGDVLHLLAIYDILRGKLERRGRMPTGITAVELNQRAQACLPALVELLLNGYGDRDQGWETSLFSH
ncbi:MAG: ribonuclease D [Candidatus Lambdaproteobacteria bacterium]|nr:ribonuclease D [Candidatus Lambdaproteobacteria bacterium]